ncbi:MAG: hypothetical protein ACI4OJ_13015, partial [Lachnospiraceae bacterium]
MEIKEVLEQCIAQDRQALSEPAPTKETGEKLVLCHQALEKALAEAGDAECADPDLTPEEQKQLSSERALLSVFHSEYERLNALVTFSCFLLARRAGEPLHSPRYMADVKTLHAAVNLSYGLDPKDARGC